MYIPVDFYKKVEELNYLNHIIYGDSVSKYTNTLIKFNTEDKANVISFDELWSKLINIGCKITYINDKEYIYIIDEIQTCGYNDKYDDIELICPLYIMRHKVNTQLVRCNIISDENIPYYIDITKNHSMLNYDFNSHKFRTCTPNNPEFIFIPCINNFNDLYYGENENTNEYRWKKLKCLFPCKITSREEIEYNDYVYDLEIPNLHNFIANGFLVHNTDSIMFTIPTPNVDKLTLSETWEIASNNSTNINNLIKSLDNEIIMKKCNIDEKYSNIWFKTEYVMPSMLFLDIKKSYSYKTLLKDGIEHKTIEHKGFPIVKSNYSEFTKNILSEMIENVLLNENIIKSNKYDEIIKIITKFKVQFDKDINNYKFNFIGTPGKWNKAAQVIDGMTLYNTLIGKKVFSFGSAGKYIYCKFKHKEKYPKGYKGITVPYEYDNDQLRLLMIQNEIIPDADTQWKRIFDKICVKIKDFAKQISGKGLFDIK